MTRTIVIAASLMLAACATGAPVVLDTACTAFKPINYSALQDSEETKKQIRGHNAVWDKLCKT
jgi:hypothetical protein